MEATWDSESSGADGALRGLGPEPGQEGVAGGEQSRGPGLAGLRSLWEERLAALGVMATPGGDLVGEPAESTVGVDLARVKQEEPDWPDVSGGLTLGPGPQRVTEIHPDEDADGGALGGRWVEQKTPDWPVAEAEQLRGPEPQPGAGGYAHSPQVKLEALDWPDAACLAPGDDLKQKNMNWLSADGELFSGPGLKQEAADWLDAEGGLSSRQDLKQEAAEWSLAQNQGLKPGALDWPDTEAGPWVKPEVEEKPDALQLQLEPELCDSGAVKLEPLEAELKEERAPVKEEANWMMVVKEERPEDCGVKLEQVCCSSPLKEEESVEDVQVKEETASPALKTEEEKELAEVAPGPPASCKRKVAMSWCETCGTEEAKYRCPRCMRYSCSLPCVKKHKAELTCSGVRDKTAFISIPEFTEMHLLSDYRFLEDVARTADHIARDVVLKRPLSNKHMNFLKNRARRQGITLKLLPTGFTKRKENSTFFDKKKQQLCWHVKLCFPQSQAVYTEKRVPEDRTLTDILRPYIDPEKSDPVIRQRLKAYIRSQAEVQILMKVESIQQNLERYYELDPCKSLLDNLKNRVIIEYPTLHVVLKVSSSDLTILH